MVSNELCYKLPQKWSGKTTQGWLEMEYFSYQVTAMKYPMQEFSLNYHSILFLADPYSNTVPARVCNEALGN